MYKTITKQTEMFVRDNAQECVMSFIRKGNILCDEAQIMLFDLPYPEEAIKAYIKKRFLCAEAENMLFQLPNPEEMLRIYIDNFPLCDEAELNYSTCQVRKIWLKSMPVCMTSVKRLK